MKMKKGSALLLVILVMSMVLLYSATVWRSASLVHALAVARQDYEQRSWLHHALMTWALAVCKENFDQMLNHLQHGPKEITIKKWPPCAQKSYQGLVKLEKRSDDEIALEAQLKSAKKNKSITCLLQHKKKESGDGDTFEIREWECK